MAKSPARRNGLNLDLGTQTFKGLGVHVSMLWVVLLFVLVTVCVCTYGGLHQGLGKREFPDTTVHGDLTVDGKTISEGKMFRKRSVGTIADGATPTITGTLMKNHDVLNYASGTNVTGALWDTAANIQSAHGVDEQGAAFDITINNSDASVFIWGALATGLTSGSGAATAAACQLPVAAAGLAPTGTFRFVQTSAKGAAAAYTIYALGLAAS